MSPLFRPTAWAVALMALFLGACSTVKYTVDDGRKVNETLLANLRALGHGERALRPAIARSAALNDPDCSRQWELPISVATSFEWDEDDRVAWVRALGVDERLTVVAAAPDAGLAVGDKIVEIQGYKKKDSNKMLAELASLRDDGDPFKVMTAAGKTITLKPFQVCRGYTRLAPPVTPGYQDFHWLMSVHPLDIFRPQITPDEALWMVLWTQGLSEEGGARIGRIGVGVGEAATGGIEMFGEIRYGVLEGLARAVRQTWETSVLSLKMIGRMLTGEVSWKNLSGPVTIADYAGQTAQLGLAHYLKFVALISISLGVLNLLPIPVLDGGHLLYYTVEIIKGGPIPERIMEVGQQIGLALLVMLMAFAFYNDLNRLISG